MATAEDVMNVLKTCDDPELGIDIVSLGLVYDVHVGPKAIGLTMTLTTPGCPLVPYFREEVVSKVKTATGVDEVTIDLTFDPPWDPSKMSDAARQQLTMLRG